MACILFIFSSCSRQGITRSPSIPQGRPRFELLGMLDEYGGRPMNDDSFIESFYPSEAAVADHFETVLREFCADESLPKDWHRIKEAAGHITFSGRRIAASINTSYVADARYGFGLYPVGVLARTVSKCASRADMLRYVVGAYIRYGDCDGRLDNLKSDHRAFFSMANNYFKVCVLENFLSRLGCANICFYTAENSTPSLLFLTFGPSEKVKVLTGIRREITLREMMIRNPDLKEAKRPHYL